MRFGSFLVIVSFLVMFGTNSLAAADKQFIQLTGWGGGKAEDVVSKAAETGFTELVVHHEKHENFTNFIKLGKQHGIGIYAWLFLGDIPAWEKAFPNLKPPLQVMNAAENKALERIQSDKTFGKSQYQSGGEPVNKIEVLTTPLLCLHDPRVLEAFKQQINEMLSVPGVKGVAFDYIGYQNYRCCYCEHSMKLFNKWNKNKPGVPYEQNLEMFSLETLVRFNNELTGYARSINPKAKIITHVYPVFLPEPLYGNRLDVDVCGQTAAWFFKPFWSYDKITKYSRVIFGEEKKYFPNSEGSAMNGIFSRSKKHAAKSPERIRKELQAILDGGGDRVQVCSMNDVLKDENIKKVFKNFFRKNDKQVEQKDALDKK